MPTKCGAFFRFLFARLSFAMLLLVTFPAAISAMGQRTVSAPRAGWRVIETRLPAADGSAVEVGPAPSSQRLSLTLTLSVDAERALALDRFLADVVAPSSARYHQWLTPAQFAAAYGASSDRVSALSAWLSSQGLRVDSMSPSGLRMSVSGFVFQVEGAFGTSIRTFQIEGRSYYANASYPQVPEELGSLVAAVDGLDDLPSGLSAGGGLETAINGYAGPLSVGALSSVVDANRVGSMTLDAARFSAAASPSELAGLNAVFRQAAAQGITTLVYEGTAGTFAASSADVTVVAGPDARAQGDGASVARPWWQNAAGLPADGFRAVPDVSAGAVGEMSQAVSAVALETGGRLGNINPVLYAMAPIAGVFTQADAAASGTWEPVSGLGRIDVAQFVKAFPRGLGSSQLSISSSANAPIHGQAFSLTITSTSTSGGAVPTGTITLTSTQAGFPGSTVSLNGGGIAVSPNYLIAGGMYAISAAYSGDANYAPTNATITITVQPEATVFRITAPANATLGSTITATVTLASASGVGTPSGSVTVTPSGITGALASTQTVTGSGGTATAAYTFTTKQAGSVALQASCTSSDASFSCYTPQTSTTTVPQATPTVVLSVTPTNPTAGQQITLSASVTGVAGIGTTGSVQFFDGSTSLGFGSAPTATFAGSLNATGSHILTAVYQGDSNYLKVTSSPVTASVNTVPTTTTVNSSATSGAYGQAITLNISVVGTTVVNGTQPTGTLTFTGAGTLTSSPVSGGSANVTLNNLGVGTYTIGTSYSGDANYAASTGNPVVLTVTQTTASLNASISSTSFTTGSSSTLTVTVTLPGNAQLAPGSTFLATIVGVTGATYPGTFAVNTGGNTGTGSVVIPAPIAGSYTLQVVCGASANFTCAPSNLSITSTSTTGGGGATGTTPTLTVLTISPTGAAVGQPITLTATVSAAAGAIAANALAGNVSFFDGTTLLGSATIATVGTNGVATFKTSLTGSTTAHSLTAMYVGNTVYAPSTSAVVSLTLSAAAANLTLTSNVATSLAGTSVVFTATISGLSATGSVPTGTVSFYIAGTTPALFGVATVGAAGNGIGLAVFSTSNLPSGAITIYAVYNGDASFGTATSNLITIGLSDYTLIFLPQTLTITQGKPGSVTGVVTAINNFAGSVILGCIPPPNVEMTCSFNPVVLNGGGPTTLTVTSTATKTARFDHGGDVPFGIAGSITFAGLVCLLIPGRRRPRVSGLLLVLLGLALTMNLGCSSGNFPAGADAGTPYGTTLLNINTAGTQNGSTVRHNYTFQVTVQ
jgi:hypothetical protein